MKSSTAETVTHISVTVERQVHSLDTFHDATDYHKPGKEGIFRRLKKKCSQVDEKQILHSTFPIADWLSRYSFRQDLPCDVIAGFTAAIMQIPQGLAYALLANVPAIIGIYMAVFPVIPYILFGTSRHTSMGTFAVMSLIVGSAVSEYSNNDAYTYSIGSENGTEIMTTYTPEEVGAHVALLVALWHIVMYVFRMGSLCALLSDVLVNSFTCGAGVHIFTSQIKSILGVTTQKFKGPFQLVKTYAEMVEKLVDSGSDHDAQITIFASLTVSAVCIAASIVSIYLIKPQFAKLTKVPFPCELIIVIAGVILSGYLNLEEVYAIPVVGTIPKGLPQPVLPQVHLATELAGVSFVSAVVSYTTVMSMALILSRGEDYHVEANQELLAMGLGNLVGSCFMCFPFAASLSRSVVSKNVGGKTQLTNVTSLVIIICILLWVADFFEPLPRAVLASIIIVALRSILLQVLDLPSFWRLSKSDGLLWITVFLSVVLIDIDYGLLIGFVLSAANVFMQGLKSYACLLGSVNGSDVYLDIKRFKAAVEIPGFKIVQYCGNLNFATRQNLHDKITKLTGLNPQDQLRRRNKNKKLQKPGETDLVGADNFGFENCHGENNTPNGLRKVEVIILDVSGVSAIDPASALQLKTIRDEYQDIDIQFLIAGCRAPIYEQLIHCNLLSGETALKVYPTVHDAVQIYIHQE